jgi:phage tail-like protein
MTEFIPRLPAAPKPPHDPLHYLLNHAVGWRAGLLDKTEVSPAGTLQLLPTPTGAGRPIADAAGTFGGLALPTGAAKDCAGNLLLLDQITGQIKLFDPCACAFVPFGCPGSIGGEPRQFLEPNGIAIFGSDLFVCDTGNHRIQVFALRGLVLRAIWDSPAAAKLAESWRPFDITFDSHGHAFVSDAANGIIHRFDRHGRWQLVIGPLTKPTHLATDHHDRIYVVDEPRNDVALFDVDGGQLGSATRADKIAPDFCPLGFPVDKNGNLYLGDWCAPEPATGNCTCAPKPDDLVRGVFDRRGDSVRITRRDAAKLLDSKVAYETVGVYRTDALDSEIYRCQWHRVVLAGEIPAGASVTVHTLSAETKYDATDLANVPASEWRTEQRTGTLASGGWDCLIASPPGRFLYLRLTFAGNGAVTPRLQSVKLYFPRISLRRFLPAVFGANSQSADFTDRLLGIFDTIQRSVEEKVDNFPRYLAPLTTPAERDPQTLLDFLTWLGSWMGLELDRAWDEPKRRRLLQEAYCLHRLRGTPEGLRRMLLIYFGWVPQRKCGCRCAPKQCEPRRSKHCSCEHALPRLILEHYKLRRWLFVGEARLGDQSVLWGNRITGRTRLNESSPLGTTKLDVTPVPSLDPFREYAHQFTVFVPAGCARTADRHAAIQRIVALNKPAHTVARLEWVEPRFRIGVQSAIGFDAVVGRYPRGFTVDGHRLGYDTVLAPRPGPKSGPGLQIGETSRVGTTTILE